MTSAPETIRMRNELGEIVSDFSLQNFHPGNFSGIIIIDCEEKLENLNYLSYKKTLEAKYPISIFSKSDFILLISEADTIPDLLYYLYDRYHFLKNVFKRDYKLFLNVSREIERDLIAFYKMNEYKFSIDEWNNSKGKDYWEVYQTTYLTKIIARNKENEESFIIDDIIDELRKNNSVKNSTLLHTSELATFTRRVRAGKLTKKIIDALSKLQQGKLLRYFAIFNQTTECWLLFYFQYGNDSDTFVDMVQRYCKLKLFYEMNWNNYHYSVLGYGFRKSKIDTGNTFDHIFLCIEDASNYKELNISDLIEANKLFGNLRIDEVKEFPDI